MKKQAPYKKYIILSDIHSNYKALKHLKSIPEYSENNVQIIFGGDYVDGLQIDKGEIEKTLDFVYKETQEHNAVALIGNHDIYLLDYLDGLNDFWLEVGGKTSCISMGIYDYSKKEIKNKLGEKVEWLRSLPIIYDNPTDKGRLVVTHGGFNLKEPIQEQSEIEECYLIRWDYIHLNCYKPHSDYEDSVIVTGHTPNPFIQLHTFDIIKDTKLGTRYFIDGASNGSPRYRNQINVLILDEDFNYLNSYKLNELGYEQSTLVEYEEMEK